MSAAKIVLDGIAVITDKDNADSAYEEMMDTAEEIGKELGILKPGDSAITGQELDKISDKDLEKNIMKYYFI